MTLILVLTTLMNGDNRSFYLYTGNPSLIVNLHIFLWKAPVLLPLLVQLFKMIELPFTCVPPPAITTPRQYTKLRKSTGNVIYDIITMLAQVYIGSVRCSR
jgi:hypothetical protein